MSRIPQRIQMSRIPQRIQMSRHHPWRAAHPDAVIVARPTRWGNPFNIGGEYFRDFMGWPVPESVAVGTVNYVSSIRHPIADAAAAAELFHAWLDNDDVNARRYLDGIETLRGRDLGCWCPRWDKTRPCPACVGDFGRYADGVRHLRCRPRMLSHEDCSECVRRDVGGPVMVWDEGLEHFAVHIECCPERLGCPACEGTGFARHPCHADLLLRLANPAVMFSWSVNHDSH